LAEKIFSTAVLPASKLFLVYSPASAAIACAPLERNQALQSGVGNVFAVFAEILIGLGHFTPSSTWLRPRPKRLCAMHVNLLRRKKSTFRWPAARCAAGNG
jgi:hypothetical protein